MLMPDIEDISDLPGDNPEGLDEPEQVQRLSVPFAHTCSYHHQALPVHIIVQIPPLLSEFGHSILSAAMGRIADTCGDGLNTLAHGYARYTGELCTACSAPFHSLHITVHRILHKLLPSPDAIHLGRGGRCTSALLGRLFDSAHRLGSLP